MPAALTPDTIFTKLRSAGHRLTPARRCLITALMTNLVPLSVAELNALLKQEQIDINITTIYRELEFLKQQGIIHELQFGEDLKRFEFGLGTHHHHIRCLNCQTITEITIPHTLTKEIANIEQQTNYKVIDHSLEFVGLCANCQ
jgi:Fe2+ or Zn2+ uptake regulation protein